MIFVTCLNAGLVARQLKSADLIVINGEGTIHDLNRPPLALLYIAYAAKHFLHKHVEIINHSSYPQGDGSLNDPRARELYQLAYRDLDFVAIREPKSAEIMEKLGISSQKSFDCLPLYIRDHFQPKEKRSEELGIVIAGSAAWEKLDSLVRYMEAMHQRGFKIRVLVGAKAFPALDDRELIRILRQKAFKDWELIEAKSMDEWLEAIHSASLVVSGRFHHSIAAYCLNTPFICLNSNTAKIEGTMELLEKEPPLSYKDPDLFEKLLERTERTLVSPLAPADLQWLCDLAEANFLGLKQEMQKELEEEKAEIKAS